MYAFICSLAVRMLYDYLLVFFFFDRTNFAAMALQANKTKRYLIMGVSKSIAKKSTK